MFFRADSNNLYRRSYNTDRLISTPGCENNQIRKKEIEKPEMKSGEKKHSAFFGTSLCFGRDSNSPPKIH